MKESTTSAENVAVLVSVCVHIDIDVDAMYLDGLKETHNNENRTKHKEDVEVR